MRTNRRVIKGVFLLALGAAVAAGLELAQGVLLRDGKAIKEIVTRVN
jgi:hypothetical protein